MQKLLICRNLTVLVGVSTFLVDPQVDVADSKDLRTTVIHLQSTLSIYPFSVSHQPSMGLHKSLLHQGYYKLQDILRIILQA